VNFTSFYQIKNQIFLTRYGALTAIEILIIPLKHAYSLILYTCLNDEY